MHRWTAWGRMAPSRFHRGGSEAAHEVQPRPEAVITLYDRGEIPPGRGGLVVSNRKPVLQVVKQFGQLQAGSARGYRSRAAPAQPLFQRIRPPCP
jgi:hypothetical protein